jgi:DNA polymerase epsilon subunit 2
MMAQRYALLHQRILRHELFRPKSLLSASNAMQQHRLTPIESLLGRRDQSSTGTVLCLGLLLQIEEGRYYLEDPTGQVPLVFERDVMQQSGACFITEHSILLVEGAFQDGFLFVQHLGPPLLEPRATTLWALTSQISHPLYRPPSTATTGRANTTSFVLLSDVHLDQPLVLRQLERLWASYAHATVCPVFVLMGNFLSSYRGHHLPQRLQAVLDELLTLWLAHPVLADHGQLVLVPGPEDSRVTAGGVVLPLPPLTPPSSYHRHAKKASVAWGSNPCRIYWQEQEMVIFRYDLLHLFQRRQVLLQPPERHHNMTATTPQKTRLSQATPDTPLAPSDLVMEDDGPSVPSSSPLPLHCRLVKTVCDQGHLVPIAGVPIYWNFDHALRLYPLPTCLVLGGDNNATGFVENYGGCDVIHPGMFDQSTSNTSRRAQEQDGGASYVEYQPSAQAVESRRRKDEYSDESDSEQQNREDSLEERVHFRLVEQF